MNTKTKNYIAILSIILLNIGLFAVGINVINHSSDEQASRTKVILDQNFDEKAFVVTDSVKSEKVVTSADFSDNSTVIELNPGAYTLSYDNGGANLVEQEIIVPEASKVEIKTQKNIEQAETEPAIQETEVKSNIEFVSPVVNCENIQFLRSFNEIHKGVDFTHEKGCWISSVASGTVLKAEWGTKGEGYFVQIDHGNGIVSQYNNGNGEFMVKAGDSVQKGQNIMYMGSSGNATMLHLHFDLKINGVFVDPEKYIKLR